MFNKRKSREDILEEASRFIESREYLVASDGGVVTCVLRLITGHVLSATATLATGTECDVQALRERADSLVLSELERLERWHLFRLGA